MESEDNPALPVQQKGGRRLSPTNIANRILKSALTPKLKFELLNETRVSRATLSRYISHLMKKGMIEELKSEGMTKIKTTKKGAEYLKLEKRNSSA